MCYKVPRADTLHDIVANPFVALKELARYMFTGRGLLLAPSPQCVIFARSALLDAAGRTVSGAPGAAGGVPPALDAHKPENIPDIEIMMIPYLVRSIFCPTALCTRS